MAFDGTIPSGVFKMSLIDKGATDGSHGCIFRDYYINNIPYCDYDLKAAPLKSIDIKKNKSIEARDNSYSASLYSINIFDDYTTVTIKLIPTKDIDSLRCFQSENTILKAKTNSSILTRNESYFIQGFLNDSGKRTDPKLYFSPFISGNCYWSNLKAGNNYFYTMVFNGQLADGVENISIVDLGNGNGERGFSFYDIIIDNPVPLKWTNLHDYFAYQSNQLLLYISNQNIFLKILYLSIIAYLILYVIGYLLIWKSLAWIFSGISKKTFNDQKNNKKSQNIQNYLKALDTPINIKVLHSSGDFAEYKPLKLTRKARVFNGRVVKYYSTGELFSRVYLHPEDYLYKIVLSFIEINERCKSSSIKAAFSECPSLLDQLNRFVKGENSDWVYVKWIDGKETICLRNKFVFNELGAYRRGRKLLGRIVADVPKIHTSLLKEKYTFAEFLKSSVKWVIRGGVKLLAATVAGYIGSNLPDFDFDFDFDADVDVDASNFDFPDFGDNESDEFADFSANDVNNSSDLRVLESDYNIAFQGYDDGTPVVNTNEFVKVVGEYGADNGEFEVFKKNNHKYIKFFDGDSADWDNWVCIDNGKFSHLSVDFSIEKA